MNKDGNKTKKSPVEASGSKRNDSIKMDQQGQQGHGQQGQGQQGRKPADSDKSNSTTRKDHK